MIDAYIFGFDDSNEAEIATGLTVFGSGDFVTIGAPDNGTGALLTRELVEHLYRRLGEWLRAKSCGIIAGTDETV